MELSSSKTTTDLQVSRKWKGRDRQQQRISPERTKVWTEPNKNNKTSAAAANRKVPVIYYLSRNGQLEHPHFMDVPLSSPEGLFLKGNIYISILHFLNLLSVFLFGRREKMKFFCLFEFGMYSFFSFSHRLV